MLLHYTLHSLGKLWEPPLEMHETLDFRGFSSLRPFPAPVEWCPPAIPRHQMPSHSQDLRWPASDEEPKPSRMIE